jgi:hypothetical protein
MVDSVDPRLPTYVTDRSAGLAGSASEVSANQLGRGEENGSGILRFLNVWSQPCQSSTKEGLRVE